jgi:A/G-specific adenine glycosylase
MASSERSRRARAREALLAWYEPRRRAFAWRRSRDPYRIWVSEVMLQQTQAPRVEPIYERFVARFPTVEALARARRSTVVRAWEGLGYHRRAVALHEAARTVVRDLDGRIPADVDRSRALPGVGPYTASAVASIAFGVPIAAVDTNARRIVARLGLGAEPDEVGDQVLREEAQAWVPTDRPGDWNQALMDLGREICRPRSPRCDRCPLATVCRFRLAGRQGRSSGRGQPAFEGSRRQTRGRILAVLRGSRTVAVSDLPARTGAAAARVDEALEGLARDGLVVVARGRARLA